ncbi:MAG: DUF2845 domain-containing protein [Woeseiaceae bacterium]|nr:DUF2845 domain-containing protein [Woeseiaceae bacterium]
MYRATGNLQSGFVLACGLLLFSQPAEALRCGNRLVRDGMHESQVRAFCGEPIATHHLGLVLRSDYPRTYGYGGISSSYYRYGYVTEVLATELVYNFGPRKLMRVLRFEGGYLVDIRTAGYGFKDTNER